MSKILSILVAVFLPIVAQAQKLNELKKFDTLQYVYKLSEADITKIYLEQHISDTACFFNKRFTTFPKDSNANEKLSTGNYVVASIEEFKVTYRLIEKTYLSFKYAQYNDDLVIFVNHDSLGQLMQPAKVRFNNHALPFDSGYGGFVYKIKNGFKGKDSNLVVATFGEDVAVETFKKVNKANKVNASKEYDVNLQYGYFVTDKPKYKIGDTVKAKAYLWNSKHGRPIRQKVIVTVRQGGKVYFKSTLKRQHAGAYVLEWVVPDSVIVDKRYTLDIGYYNSTNFVEKSVDFLVEDYVLNQNKFDAVVNADLYKGDDIRMMFAAVDANGFPLTDVKCSYTLSVQEIIELNKDTIHMPFEWETLFLKKDTLLPYDKLATLVIPESSLLPYSAKYKLDITLKDLNSQEEREFSFIVNKDCKAERIVFEQNDHKVEVHVIKNGVDAQQEFIYVKKCTNSDTLFIKIKTPFIDTLCNRPEFVGLMQQDTFVASFVPVIQYTQWILAKGEHTVDSLKIHLEHPLRGLVHYKLFRGTKEILSSASTVVDLIIPDKSKDIFTLLYTTNLGNAIHTNFRKIVIESPYKKLSIESNFPETAFPGQQLAIDMTISNYNKKPVKNADILSYAMNAQFGENYLNPFIYVPRPYMAMVENSKVDIDIINTSDLEIESSEIFITQSHIERFNLYKNDFYRLFYPDTGISELAIPIVYDVAEVLLVVRNGLYHYLPKYIMIDSVLLDIYEKNWVNDFSIPIKPGKHTIQFRYADRIFRYTTNFKAGEKKIIVAHSLYLDLMQLNIPAPLVCIDSSDALQLSDSEKLMNLASISLLPSYESYDSIAIVSDRGTAFESLDNYRNSLAINGEDYLAIFYKNKNDKIYVYRGKDRYLLAKGLQVNKWSEIKNELTYVNYAIHSSESIFSALEKDIEVEDICFLLARDSSRDGIHNLEYNSNYMTNYTRTPYQTTYGQLYDLRLGRANFHLNIVGRFNYVSALWLVNKDQIEMSTFLPCRGGSNYNFYVNSGSYDLYVLFKNNTFKKYSRLHASDSFYVVLDPTQIKADTLQLGSLDEPLEIYRKLNEIPMRPFYFAPTQNEPYIKIEQDRKMKHAYIFGNVVGSGFNRIAGAQVFLELNGVYKLGAITNEEGNFEIKTVPSASYRIKTIADGYLMNTTSLIVLNNNCKYTMEIKLDALKTKLPLLEEVEKSYRLIAFDSEKDNEQLHVSAFDAEGRNAVSDYLVAIYQGNDIQLQKMMKDVDELPVIRKNAVFRIVCVKKGYYPIVITDVKFIYGMQYDLEILFKPNPKNFPDSIIYNSRMQDVNVRAKEKDKGKPIEVSYRKENVTGISGVILNEARVNLAGAIIKLFLNGIKTKEGVSDKYGKFLFSNLTPGIYAVEVIFAGKEKRFIEDILVSKDNITHCDKIILIDHSKALKGISVKAKKSVPPPIDVSKPGSAPAITARTIEALASTDPLHAATLKAGVYTTRGNSFNLSGGRSGNTLFMVDGVLVRDASRAGSVYGSSSGSTVTRVIVPEKTDFDFDAMINTIATDSSLNDVRSNFKDNAFWMPALRTNRKGKAHFTVKLPDNITTWRINTLVAGRRFFYGQQKQNIRVFKPMMSLSIAPRFLYRGDSIVAKVKFVNLTQQVKPLHMDVQINNMIQWQMDSNINEAYVREVQLQGINDTIHWNVGLKGISDYQDREVLDIPIFETSMTNYQNQSLYLNADSNYLIHFLPNTKGRVIVNNKIYEKVLYEAEQLSNYPYGCAEQTASKLRALLVKEQLLKSVDKSFHDGHLIRKMINKLAGMRNSDKTWGWWTGQGTDWKITLYVADILAKADAQGYSNSVYVPAFELLNDELGSLSFGIKAQAYEVLLRNENLNDVHKVQFEAINENKLSALQRLYQYHSMYLLKKPVPKDKIYAAMLELTNGRRHSYYANFFDDPYAQLFIAFNLLQGTVYEKQILRLFEEKLITATNGSSLNTYTRSYMLEVLVTKYLASNKDTLVAKIKVNNGELITDFPAVFPIADTQMQINHKGAPLFVNTIEEEIVSQPKIKDTFFVVKVKFESSIAPTQLIKVGDHVNLNIYVEPIKTSSHVMIEIPLPSGVQVRDKLSLIGGRHVEYLKDRIIIYYDHLNAGPLLLNIGCIANFRGVMQVPAAKASLMYYPYIYGCNENSTLVVQ